MNDNDNPDATATPVGAQIGDLDVAAIRARMALRGQTHGYDGYEPGAMDELRSAHLAGHVSEAAYERFRALARAYDALIPLYEDARDDLRMTEAALSAAESARDAAEGAIERVRAWTKSHPPTHDVRSTEGYWRAQGDVLAALDPAVPATEAVCVCPTDDFCPKCHPRWYAKWATEVASETEHFIRIGNDPDHVRADGTCDCTEPAKESR